MEIKITYIGINEYGIKGVWCGFCPDKTKVIQEKRILYPANGKILKHKETENLYYSVILTDEDSQENYEEIEERNTQNDITE